MSSMAPHSRRCLSLRPDNGLPIHASTDIGASRCGHIQTNLSPQATYFHFASKTFFDFSSEYISKVTVLNVGQVEKRLIKVQKVNIFPLLSQWGIYSLCRPCVQFSSHRQVSPRYMRHYSRIPGAPRHASYSRVRGGNEWRGE